MSTNGPVCPVPTSSTHTERRGLAWVIGAFVICPCHLPLTLGLAATLLSGTAAGALITGHPYIAGTAITAAWVAATWRGYTTCGRHVRLRVRQFRTTTLGSRPETHLCWHVRAGLSA